MTAGRAFAPPKEPVYPCGACSVCTSAADEKAFVDRVQQWGGHVEVLGKPKECLRKAEYDEYWAKKAARAES